jgi:hypothetical protein
MFHQGGNEMRAFKASWSWAVLFAPGFLCACVGLELDEFDEMDEEATSDITLASTADCVGGANGFIDISDSQSGTVQRLFTIRDDSASTRITQESATISGASRGYAKISGGTRVGDLLWMDWEERNSAGTVIRRVQCGPFQVTVNNRSYTTAAKATSGSLRRFRACARPAGSSVSICNNWW